MRLIKNLNEFDNLNEGILSFLSKTFKNALSSKKGKLEDVIKKIGKARSEEVDNAISIEKEIADRGKGESTEDKFILTNLKKQSRTHSALKGSEINSLIKNAREIIDEDPQLEALFNSELARIEVETQEKLIKSISSYAESNYISQLNSEFDDLVKDANKKSSYAESLSSSPSYMPDINVPSNMSDDVISFLNLNSKEAAFTCRELDSDNLSKYYTQIKDFFFDLEDKYSTSMDEMKRSKREAEKFGERSSIKKIERDEINLKYHLRKAIDKLRGRLNAIEKEMRNRRNA